MTTNHTIWLIDDDAALRLILEDTFSDAGLSVQVFANAKGAWARLNDVLKGNESRDTLPDIILTDIRMPLMDGLSFSHWMHTNFPALPVIVMTAHSDLKSAVDSYDTGAFEYLPKPFDLDHAVSVVNKAIESRRSDNNKNKLPAAEPLSHANLPNTAAQQPVTSTDNAKVTAAKPAKTPKASIPKTSKPKPHKSSQSADTSQPAIIGQSSAMQTVFRAIGRLASSPITVLITGESGTGKELVAGALHQNSPRRNQPFIALNMAAIPHELIESELFGHEKGAFTGASTQRQGRFEQANGGTLFLDEIGDMPFSTQTRLLRVLANGEFFRVGGQKPIKVDVRIVAATHQNLEQLVKEGKFREDLFYRLNVIRLPLPPLRARPDDIPELVDFFMARAAIEMNTDVKQLSDDALILMQQFDWPGNVRQLENACRWITVMATGDVIGVADLPPDLIEFAAQLYRQQSEQNTEPTIEPNKAPQTSEPAQSQLQKNTPQTPTPFSTPSHPSTTDWQTLLMQWADTALSQGKTDILQLATPEFEKILISVALKHTKGRKGEASELLGWGRNTLTRKIKLLDIED